MFSLPEGLTLARALIASCPRALAATLKKPSERLQTRIDAAQTALMDRQRQNTLTEEDTRLLDGEIDGCFIGLKLRLDGYAALPPSKQPKSQRASTLLRQLFGDSGLSFLRDNYPAQLAAMRILIKRIDADKLAGETDVLWGPACRDHTRRLPPRYERTANGLCKRDVRVYLGEKKAAAGVITGHEMSGEVVEVGAGANARMGETVAVCPIRCCGTCSFCREGYRNRCPSRKTLGYDEDGGIAEYVKIPAQLVALGHLLPMDRAIAPQVRAFLEPFACVLNSIEEIGTGPGRALAIVGGGPMGLVHLVAGKAYGAGPILVVEPEAERRAVALELGADAACTPEEAAAIGKEMTGG